MPDQVRHDECLASITIGQSLGIRTFRQLVHSPYRIICRVIGQEAFVPVVADGRRDMQALLERRLLGR